MTQILPAVFVIATRNRAPILRRTLESLALQSAQPSEIVIVDASSDALTRNVCVDEAVPGLKAKITWQSAEIIGAAAQRNQGVQFSSQPIVGFIDDDIVFEPDCVRRLWTALESDSYLGGVNAMIVNQRYVTPGNVSRIIFRLMAGHAEQSYAGRVLGPAVNLLPEDREELGEIVSVEWLNTTCTLYRREAIPDPAFPPFEGYSMLEDLSLSLAVGKTWKLANARTARIFHDSQPGSHKSDAGALARMHILNRHYVMTRILGRQRARDYAKLVIWICFSHCAALKTASGRRTFPRRLAGELDALRTIMFHRRSLAQ